MTDESAEQWWNWCSSDGMVQAEIDVAENDQRCQIVNFAALESGKGHGRRAMQELRAKYSYIRTIGIGGAGEASRAFWFAMAREGLVDEMLDIDGRREWPEAE